MRAHCVLLMAATMRADRRRSFAALSYTRLMLVMVRRVLRKSTRRWLLTAVAIALVGAQSLGLHHRIEHGTATGWSSSAAIEPVDVHEHVAANAEPGEPESNEHNCAAIDALALGDGLPLVALQAPTTSQAPERVDHRNTHSAQPLRLQPFQARAPPVLSS